MFLHAEDAYFGQWNPKTFAAQASDAGRVAPDRPLRHAPGPATYLLEPFLDAAGRGEYRKQLLAILRETAELEGRLEDGGRLDAIQKSITVALTMLESIRAAKREAVR